MATARMTPKILQETVDALAECGGNQTTASVAIGITRQSFVGRLQRARQEGFVAKAMAPVAAEPKVVNASAAVKNILMKHTATIAELGRATGVAEGDVLDAIDELKANGVNIIRESDKWGIGKAVAASWIGGSKFELVSRPDNTFLFGACGDQHVCSKYFRADVSDDLYRRYTEHDVQAVFNTGNWIDGEARFNTYDITHHGIDSQARQLALQYPKADYPTYAVWGDDHEGWYAQHDGIDVGRYVEGIMREEGHNWHDLGYLEAHVRLVNANTGKSSILAVVHPGGGSSYATSYRPQKIVESLEGGEKPAVLLLGHYHKMEMGMTRNVWVAQTGTCMDQSPFMRKKSIEAHVGGAMIGLEQDPNTGAITGFTPTMWRYFNRAFYTDAGMANNRWSKHGPVTPIPRGIQI